jgi:AcrR family transcriptional regulator
LTVATAPERSRKGADRTQEVARAALAAFCNGGYRLTQMAHVSERMGVSVGSIYRTVESKEALFHLAVLEATGSLPTYLDLPLRVSGLRETAEHLRRVASLDRLWSTLEDANAHGAPADVRAEAEAIAGQLYESLSRRAAIISLLDRCAHEIPELAQIFDTEVRGRLMQDLVTWVTDRKLAGDASPARAAVLARGAMEAIAWMAKSRRGDPTAGDMAEADARAAAIRIFVGAFDYGAR